ncbi:P-loop containing nucleoside triphosphate hydrolase protein [Leucogyrophana mollusca]|uniref:P-loop containing nucleoside triphosphate hydrolase protein n=1 Tax=Leucogyrophana mollusca TaxID=85980 RepID=A0ACB8BKY9_9AGAM|nr:P-loop containing nucleoside triphosphate hydrolase protein [Leucogyrophana mollusca]
MQLINRLRRRSEALTNTPAKQEKSLFTEKRLGVWRILIAKESTFYVPGFEWTLLATNFPLCRRAFADIYAISASMFWCLMLTYLWTAIEPSMSLDLSNRLLFCIEHRILGKTTGDDAVAGLYWAIIARVVCSVISGVVHWASKHIIIIYGAQIKYHFEERILEANLKRDLPTSEDHDALARTNPGDVFDCLQRTAQLAKELVSFLLQLRVVHGVLGSSLHHVGPIFVALSIVPLIARTTLKSDLWTKAYFVQAVDEYFLRKSALYKLSNATFKQEVMGGNIAAYVLKEYRRARKALRNTPDEQAEELYRHSSTAFPGIFSEICGDLPMLYFAILAIFRPAELSLIHLAILEQTSISLRYTFSTLMWMSESWPGELSGMKTLYRVLDLKNTMKDGEIPYPPQSQFHEGGMELDIRNVSFTYPGSKAERSALADVSLSIKRGQLVVIVGANGSGKSTIIKLLNRSYDPTSGEILVDGRPIEDYQVMDLRQAIANLTQDHRLFPLSITENIGLGHPEMMADRGKITEAAKLAGAHALIENFSAGYDAILEPVSTGYMSWAGSVNEDIHEEFKKMEKTAQVSGGERQRLVASRTFMRLFSDDIKLVMVDEPSSALDPQGEFELFERLRQARQGRTMIFVTHRFGHLTKYADIIVCMKDGAVVETGTHEDLLAKMGEYAHLYNVQAQAFVTDAKAWFSLAVCAVKLSTTF